MRIIWAVALLVTAGCSTTAIPAGPAAPQVAKPLVPCTEPRPQVCTMEYAPACASLAAGGFRTYANGCTACADPAATGYRDGACPE